MFSVTRLLTGEAVWWKSLLRDQGSGLCPSSLFLLVPRSGPMSKANRTERRCHRKARQSLGARCRMRTLWQGVVKEETFL